MVQLVYSVLRHTPRPALLMLRLDWKPFVNELEHEVLVVGVVVQHWCALIMWIPCRSRMMRMMIVMTLIFPVCFTDATTVELWCKQRQTQAQPKTYFSTESNFILIFIIFILFHSFSRVYDIYLTCLVTQFWSEENRTVCVFVCVCVQLGGHCFQFLIKRTSGIWLVFIWL